MQYFFLTGWPSQEAKNVNVIWTKCEIINHVPEPWLNYKNHFKKFKNGWTVKPMKAPPNGHFFYGDTEVAEARTD